MRVVRLLAVNLLLLLLLGGAGLLALEAWWERQAEAGWARLDANHRPVYQWRTVTPDGTPVGSRRGRLRLMTHPTVVYVNLPGQRTAQFHIDERGFRETGVPPAGPGAPRIVLVGGSTAFGTGLDADEQTFAAALARELGGAEVVNAAVLGHRSGQELSYLTHELVDLEPDLVISLGGVNDFAQLGRPRTRWFDVNGAEQTHARLRLLHRLVYADLPTRLAAAWRALLPQLALQLGLDAVEARAVPGPPLELEDLVESYAGNARKMERIGAAFGARFVLVLQPHRANLSQRMPEPPWDRYPVFRDRVARALRPRGVPVLDLNDRRLPWRASMFMDEIHLDAAGNALMAQRVARFVEASGLLEPGGPVSGEAVPVPAPAPPARP